MTHIGIDPGAVTGFAALYEDGHEWWAFEPIERVMSKPWIVGLEIVQAFSLRFPASDAPDLVIGIETPVPGPSILVYGAQMAMFGALMAGLSEYRLVIVNPSESKMVISGKGNAKKDDMFHDLIRSGVEPPTGNKKEREAKVDAYAHALVVRRKTLGIPLR